MKNANLDGRGERLEVQEIGRRLGQASLGRFHWRTPWQQQGFFFLTTPMVIGPLKQTKAGNVWEDKDKPVNQLWPWLLLG